MKNIFLVLVLFISFWSHVFPQRGNLISSQQDKECHKYESSCSACIRNNKCQWCSSVKLDANNNHHCFSRNTSLEHYCKDSNISNPYNELKILAAEPLSEGLDGRKIVQLTPQRISLSIRKNDPVKLDLTYRQVKDYPLDLYYLMDLSYSMRPSKRTLATLGKALAEKMRSLTSQFRIGFGSFVDKVLPPFVNTRPAKLKRPCNSADCQTPFSFKNNLPLTENEVEFKAKVDAAKISTNIDGPEGGFDALMQTMVCKNQIGWKDEVRKIIVFSTDGSFHLAGDGKLAGVVLPNNGTCSLDSNGFYTKYNEFDYPSIGQINEVAQKEGMNILFAAKGNEKLYRSLSSAIEGSFYETLSTDSSNIIDVLGDVYNNITGRVTIVQSQDSVNKNISLKIQSKCNGLHFSDRNYCDGVKEGQNVQFQLIVELTDCPKDKNNRKTTIKVGTLQEWTEIDIYMNCDCDCETTPYYSNSTDDRHCDKDGKGAGKKECGVCICNEGYFGAQCQCNVQGRSGSTSGNKCRDTETYGDAAKVCSGFGRCECETCQCKRDHDGKFCQCNKALCRNKLDAETFCNGHGTCDCDKCRCDDGYTGDFCECRDDSVCREPGSNEICSGKGNCDCGECSCFQDKIPYMGEFCEECPSCDNGKCDEFKDCIQCQKFKTGEFKKDCNENCNLTFHSALSLEDASKQHASSCSYNDEETGCGFSFTYRYIRKGEYELFVKDEQDCPEPVDFVAVIMGVSAGVVAVGILTLLIWKIVTTIHDRREYAKFMDESQNIKWGADTNPTYVGATRTVANPTFKN